MTADYSSDIPRLRRTVGDLLALSAIPEAWVEKEPAAIQLRYLQTLTEIGVEKNTTIVFPLPVDIISQWVRAFAEKK